MWFHFISIYLGNIRSVKLYIIAKTGKEVHSIAFLFKCRFVRDISHAMHFRLDEGALMWEKVLTELGCGAFQPG
jgi:hypothetical protein